MSFEKLREIMLVIGIGLFLTVALIIAFISTLNARKGGQIIVSVQDVLVKGFQKSDTVRNQSTLATFAEELNGKQIGDLKIDASNLFVINTNGDIQVQSQKINKEFMPVEISPTEDNGNILLAFIPSDMIKHGSDLIWNSTLYLKAKNGGTPTNPIYEYMHVQKDAKKIGELIDWQLANPVKDTSAPSKVIPSKDAMKTYNEGLRGFMSSGYMSFWGFKSEDSAKSYRDKFFPAGIVVSSDTATPVFGIAIEMVVN